MSSVNGSSNHNPMTSTSLSSETMENDLQKLREQYYTDSQKQKGLFFRKQEKFECAQTLVQSNYQNKEQLLDLFASMIYEDPDHNALVLKYAVFKYIAHPELYPAITHWMFHVIRQMLTRVQIFDVIIDLQGLTISAVERYKDFCRVVSEEGLKNGGNFLLNTRYIHVHNPPSFIRQAVALVLPLVDPCIGAKIVIPTK